MSDGRRPARVAIRATSTAAPAAPITVQVSAMPPIASEPDMRAAASVLTAIPIDTPTPAEDLGADQHPQHPALHGPWSDPGPSGRVRGLVPIWARRPHTNHDCAGRHAGGQDGTVPRVGP